MSCKCDCNICKRAIYSTAVTVITVDGTDTLVIDIPASTYFDGYQYCLFVIQTIPAAATRYMPVAISIGGVTTTVYPLVKCDCSQVTQCAISSRHRYKVRVSTNGNGGVFKVLSGLSCAPNNDLASLPVITAAAAPAATPASASVKIASSAAVTKKSTATTKPATVDTMTVNAATVNVKKEDNQ